MLRAKGYELVRSHGSHFIFKKPGDPRPVSIPVHHGRVRDCYVRQIEKL